MTIDEVDPEEFSESALPPVVEELAVPLALNALQPWHRPRKQIVREEQWFRRSRQLLTDLNIGTVNGPTEVRYLTLPGIDYLDVRVLSDLCAQLGCRLVSTGFLAAEEGNPVKARAQVREETLKQTKRIADNSLTLPMRLEEISNLRSQAFQDVKRRGPFDIVNIDACGSIARPAANQASRLLDAIHRLVELQFNSRRKPWLMFLTTDARPDNISAELNAAFKAAILSNAAHNEEFETEAKILFTAGPQESLGDAIDRTAAEEANFIFYFALGYSKYLLGNCGGMQWDVKVHDSFCYSTTADGEVPTMSSLVFEFLPRQQPMADQFGAVLAAPVVHIPAENYSIRALRKTVAMQNLDERLMNDANLRALMSERTKKLLEEAGYHADILASYDQFAGA